MSNFEQKSPDRTRQSLRLDPAVWKRIDRSRSQRAGNISRNSWIAEAILEKLDRESQQQLLAKGDGSDV